jgi:hypothetical protein
MGRAWTARRRHKGSVRPSMLKKMVRPVYESPVSEVCIDPSQFGSTAGVSSRMDDGQCYEFIYIASCETKFAEKGPAIGHLTGLRGANLAAEGDRCPH